MSRPAGVTVSAVVLIIGSLLTILMGIYMLSPALFLPESMPETQLPSPMVYSVKIMSFACFGAALWGLLTAVNLFRMRSWSRLSILVIAVLILFTFVPSLLLFLLLPLLVPDVVLIRQSSYLYVLAALHAVPIFFGIVWLVYFNRAAVKAAFLQRLSQEEGPRRPLSITVIAWHAMIFGLCTFAMLFQRWPAYFFGFVLGGWVGSIISIATAAFEMTVGVGLLKLKPWSHTAAVWFCIYSMVQTLFFAIMPNTTALIEAVQREVSPTLRLSPVVLPQAFFWILALVGWLTFGTALWYLLTRKKAFLKAAKAAQSTA
jgi:hypothetical protein